MEPVILASSSPRRQEILKLLNIPFVVHPADITETYPADMKNVEVPEYLAAQKVRSIVHSLPEGQENQWVLGADTVIVFKDRIYGKPKSREEAEEFLTAFQGQTHQVVTGIALFNSELHSLSSRININNVTFAPMTAKEIEWYLETDEWHGAAGAYRIQGLASCFIKRLEGSESGVMGLPIFELCDMLKEQNYSLIE